jgi:hypothetical protein
LTTYYANVVNDGGFTFGMDYTTPVTWKFAPRALKGSYTSLILPAHMQAWAKTQRKPWVGTYRELQRIGSDLRQS